MLRRRDWFLFPAISLLTLVLLLTPVEWISRRLFSGSRENALGCMVLNDPTGVRAVPNCVCTYKIPEADPVQYRFNNCGYRAGIECGPKPTNTFRIVLIGTSMAEGLHVPWERTFAALLPRELSQETGQRVDLFDEALEWETPHRIDLHFGDILIPQPDMILWTVTKWDVENASLVEPPRAMFARKTLSGARLARALDHVRAELQDKTFIAVLKDGSRHVFGFLLPGTSFMVEHLLATSPDEYLEHYLASDDETAFLDAEPGVKWRSQLRQFEYYAADIEMHARRAGIPLVAAVLPTRAEATLISIGQWPKGLDPYKFGEEVRSIVERHGGKYVDVLHAFSDVPDNDQFYYPVDGHPNAGGQALFAKLLAKELSQTVFPHSQLRHVQNQSSAPWR